jgi:hypothetical protein
MPAQVPYSGVPEVAPENRPVSYRSQNVPVAAFGGNIADALKHLGEVTEKSGGELYSRAIAMQQLDQAAEASEAASKHAEVVADRYVQYEQRKGKNAREAYKPFVDEIKQARAAIRDSLGSEYAKKQFDGETRRTEVQTIFSAGKHAATEQRKYVIDASDARTQQIVEEAGASPEDQAAVDSARIRAAREAKRAGELAGESEDTQNLRQTRVQSQITSARVQGSIKTNPGKAQKILTDDANKGFTDLQTGTALQDKVTQANRTVGSRVAADDLASGKNAAWGGVKVDLPRAQEAVAASVEGGGKYDSVGPTVVVKGVFGQDVQDRTLGKYAIRESELQAKLKTAGLPSMTAEAFLKDKAAQDKVFNVAFGEIQSRKGNFNDAYLEWMGGQGGQGVAKANAKLGRNAPPDEVTRVTSEVGRKIAPQDEETSLLLRQKFESERTRQEVQERHGSAVANITIQDAMSAKGDGKLPTTEEDITSQSPEVKAAWEALLPQQRIKNLETMRQNALNGGYDFTPETKRKYHQLIGQLKSDDENQRLEAMQTNVQELKIPVDAKQELIKAQQKVLANKSRNVSVEFAMRNFRSTLDSLRLNKDEMNQFRGGLHTGMQLIQESEGRPATAQEIRSLGSQLLEEIPVKRRFWMDGKQKRFMSELPTDNATLDRLHDELADRGITSPTDEQLHDAWLGHGAYQQLFGKGAK